MCEQLESNEVRTSLIDGVTFDYQPIEYAVVDDMAVFEGDIVLGAVAELEQLSDDLRAIADAVEADLGEPPEGVEFGVGITGQRFRWPGCAIAYTVANDLPNRSRVSGAIAHWEQNTQLRFVERNAANAGSHPNWLHFRPADGCWSSVGMRGVGQQEIGLADGCGTGSTIHEIGHAVGLWHEQSREDRDNHIRILWQNITAGREHNFNQHITDGDDYGGYDYNSIMHYGPTAFTRNGQPTIETIPPGVPIGQRNGLSAGDIGAVSAMYSNCEPTRSWLGVQFTGRVRGGQTQCWFTHSWPAHWHVDWTVVPLDPPRDEGPQIEWTVQVTHQTDRLLKYFICVKNLVDYDVRVEARYNVMGWLR